MKNMLKSSLTFTFIVMAHINIALNNPKKLQKDLQIMSSKI